MWRLALNTLENWDAERREHPWRRAAGVRGRVERAESLVIQCLITALRRHIELGATLDQAFGYAKVGKGAPAFDPDHDLRIACEVFERRFIKGEPANEAGRKAGEKFGVGYKQALDAFNRTKLDEFNKNKNDLYALRAHWNKRVTAKRGPIWTVAEKKRLKKYYGSRPEAQAFLVNEDNPSDLPPPLNPPD